MKKKRILSLILSLMMLFTLVLPIGSFADEFDTQDEYVDDQQVEDNDSYDENESADDTDASDDADSYDEIVNNEEAGTNEEAGINGETDINEEVGTNDDTGSYNVADNGDEDTNSYDEAEFGDVANASNEEVAGDDADFVENDDYVVVEEEVPFEEGYVTVYKDTTVYVAESEEEELGSFTEDAVVYAFVTSDEELSENSWLKIIFDTAEAKEANEDLLCGYVHFGDAAIMSQEDVDLLWNEMQYDVTVRDYGGIILPVAPYASKAVEDGGEIVAAGVEEVNDYEELFSAVVLSIDTQPEDWTGAETANATYTVAATGGTEPYTYQWQYSRNNGASWFDRGGATEATFSILAKGRDGFLWHCVVTDAAGTSVTSNAARLTIGAAALEIETQPEDWTGAETANATYTVAVTGGTEPYTYQWQYSRNNGTTWYDRGGATEANFSIPAKGRDGFLWHCVVTDAAGTSVTSNAARLTTNNDIEVDDVVYTIISNDKVELKEYKGSADAVTIPKEVEGYTVTAIGEEAFINKDSLVSVDLPNSIEIIGARAFKGCSNLSRMATHD